MSKVTDVILTTLADESAAIAALNTKVAEKHECPVFSDMSYQNTAGDKHMQCSVYLGAFNYLDMAEFTALLRSLGWDAPEYVQLFAKEENEDTFQQIDWRRDPSAAPLETHPFIQVSMIADVCGACGFPRRRHRE